VRGLYGPRKSWGKSVHVIQVLIAIANPNTNANSD